MNHLRKAIYLVSRICILLLISGYAYATTYTPIDFIYNSERSPVTGTPVYDGVPFDIPAGSGNTWDFISDGSAGLKTLSIDLNVFGAQNAYTLMNTSWGVNGEMHTWLTFTGSEGAVYTKELINGVDIRDWYNGGWANSINDTTTKNIWYVGTARLDEQTITLPIEFSTQYLTNITIYDNGGMGYHRAFISGLTVGSTGENPVPEPATMFLFSIGLLSLAGVSRRKK